MKAATAEELAADSLNPQSASVTIVETPHGQSVMGDTVDKALAEHKPMWTFSGGFGATACSILLAGEYHEFAVLRNAAPN